MRQRDLHTLYFKHLYYEQHPIYLYRKILGKQIIKDILKRSKYTVNIICRIYLHTNTDYLTLRCELKNTVNTANRWFPLN